MLLYLILAALAYLLGSIPFGFLLVLLVRREDIRSKGSGNIGATNVIRSGAKGLGVLTFLLDAGKGYAAVALAGYLAVRFGSQYGALRGDAMTLAALFAILGHIFPVWLRFRGGKGVATGFGVFLALSPLAAAASLGVFLVVVVLSRYVSLASILAAIAFPLFALWLPPGERTILYVVAVFAASALIVAKHSRNIVRLLQGTEYRFGRPKPTAA